MKYNVELNLEDRNSLSILISKVKTNSIVLEFGPANGRMTKYMKEQLNCRIYAVEIDAEAAKDAEQYTEKIIVDSIENYTWQQEFKDIKFDHIIFADVLEHLYYPEKVLASLKDFLQEDGSVLISIPNIAHNAIIINLLKNEFNYSPTGLLDDTHIRFFTKKTFDKLIEKVGLYRAFETAIFLNPENTEFLNSYDDLPDEVSKFVRQQYFGEAYQLIYELKKHSCDVITDFSEEHKSYSRYFIQLFLDHSNGISEENSIKLPVAQHTDIQEFVFDLSDKRAITNLRLDPLNDSCVIEIESLRLIKSDGTEIDLYGQIASNALIHHGNSYFFDHNDPQVYFNDFCLDGLEAKGIIAKIRFAHVGTDALKMCINQIIIDKDHIIVLKNSELDQTRNELDQTRNELIAVYSSKSWKITKPLRKIRELL